MGSNPNGVTKPKMPGISDFGHFRLRAFVGIKPKDLYQRKRGDENKSHRKVGFVFLALWQLAPPQGMGCGKTPFWRIPTDKSQVFGEFQRIKAKYLANSNGVSLFFLISFYFRLPKLVPLINLYQEQELYYKI